MKKKPTKRKDRFASPKFTYVNIHYVRMDKADKQEGSMLKGVLILDWAAKGIGFGQMTFRQKGRSLRKLSIECESENMGRAFVKKALEHLAATVKIVE